MQVTRFPGRRLASIRVSRPLSGCLINFKIIWDGLLARARSPPPSHQTQIFKLCHRVFANGCIAVKLPKYKNVAVQRAQLLKAATMCAGFDETGAANEADSASSAVAAFSDESSDEQWTMVA